MSVAEAAEFFKQVPQIARRLLTLQDVGLSYLRLGQSALTLSGGEAQRIKLSLELSRRDTGRTVYLLDEPTTGLDPISRESLWRYLERLNTKDGVTFFLTTQYLEEADRLAHEVAILDAGKIVAQGSLLKKVI